MPAQANLLNSPEFLELVRRAWLAPMRREDITDDTVPGASAEIVWEALTALRKAQAFISPKDLSSPNALPNWHNATDNLQRICREIVQHTHNGSALDVLANERAGASFITQQYVEEMQTNLAFDGYSAEYEDIRSVLLGERPAATHAERITCNYHAIMQDLGDMADAPYTAEMLDELYARLVHGADEPNKEDSLASTALLVPHSPLEKHYVAHSQPGDPATLQVAVDVANGYAGSPQRHPIMTSMLVNCQFWRAPLYPSCNNLMGCIASRWYLVREGFPVMRYVPKIRILEKWRLGMYEQVESFSYAEAMGVAEVEGDWTLYYDAVMGLMLHEIVAMEHSLTLRAAVDTTAIEGIARIPYLSYRQRDVLRQAVLAPETDFSIAEQKKKYGVVYSTARVDLEKLVEAGYLTRIIKGQAYAYRAASNLRSILSK